MRSLKCGVWSVECGAESLEGDVWSVECGIESVKCEVRKAKRLEHVVWRGESEG